MRLFQHPKVKFAPSILNADPLDLRGALKIIKRGGGDQVHVDIMDGHFVQNLSMGPHVIHSLKAATRLPLDVHLMVTDPKRFIDPFLKAGANALTLHVESRGPLKDLLKKVRRWGARAAVALRPRTPLAALRGLLPHVDMVLLMTVEPGFGGQRFRKDVLSKIRTLRQRVRRMRPVLDIQVDGGIDPRTVASVVKAGANVIVTGWAVFGSRDPVAALKRLRKLATAAQRSS